MGGGGGGGGVAIIKYSGAGVLHVIRNRNLATKKGSLRPSCPRPRNKFATVVEVCPLSIMYSDVSRYRSILLLWPKTDDQFIELRMTVRKCARADTSGNQTMGPPCRTPTCCALDHSSSYCVGFVVS